MVPMEIALLILGVIIFVISFLLPNTGRKSESELEAERADIRKLMEQELADMKLRVSEAANDTVDYATERAERSLERTANEKIMAVNEYSEVIMDGINKSHQEVMFLYDMINDKKTDLANSVRKAEATVRDVSTVSVNMQKAIEQLQNQMDVISASRRGLTPEQKAIFGDDVKETPKKASDDFVPIVAPIEIQMPVEKQPAQPMAMDIISGKVFKGTVDNAPKAPVMPEAAPLPSKPAAQPVSGENNNQRILAMYEKGMTEVDIAKELKLGVGEVKLVIDLYK